MSDIVIELVRRAPVPARASLAVLLILLIVGIRIAWARLQSWEKEQVLGLIRYPWRHPGLCLCIVAALALALLVPIAKEGPEPGTDKITPPATVTGIPGEDVAKSIKRGERETGVRSPTGTQSLGMVEVASQPQDADVYLNWKLKGRTSVTLKRSEVIGLLVVVKEGYEAAFRQINAPEEGGLRFALRPERKRPRTRLLLTVPEGVSWEFVSSLRSQLIEEGFTVLGQQEALDFTRELGQAGGLSHQGLRAWARARFETDLLVAARFRQTSRELSEQELGYFGTREAVKGTIRAEVSIDLEIVDFRSGDHLAVVSSTGSSFALERSQGLQKALTQATTESAKRLRERIRA